MVQHVDDSGNLVEFQTLKGQIQIPLNPDGSTRKIEFQTLKGQIQIARKSRKIKLWFNI